VTAKGGHRYVVREDGPPPRPWAVVDTESGLVVERFAAEVRAEAVAELRNRDSRKTGGAP